MNDKDIATKELAINIRTIIKELDINQDKFSRITDLRQGQVSEIIRGVRPNLSWFVLYQIAKALGTSMESLIEGTYNIDNISKHLNRPITQKQSAAPKRRKAYMISKLDSGDVKDQERKRQN